MAGFMSGAIDPALLSGGINSDSPDSHTPTADHSNSNSNTTAPSTAAYASHPSLNPHASSAYPNSHTSLAQNASSPHPAPPPTSFSNLPNHHGLNLNFSSAQPFAGATLNPPGSASSTALLNGSAPAQGTPSNTDTPLLNGMSAKDQEMHQKDQELAQFLLKMEEYKPVIPDEVAAYYLQRVGFECTDVKVQRLLVLACQKFVSDIAQDAFSYARTRTGQAPGGRQGPLAPNSNSAGLANGAVNNVGARKDRTRTVLTQEDLAQALAEYGINASRAPYYL